MNGDTNTDAACPCGTCTCPRVVFNPPGRAAIAYRDGDYSSFRHALLQPLDGEQELSQIVDGRLVQIWRPTAQGDLALQMVEWWAYLADVLSFYSERVATQAYLRTADLPESVNRLIEILGYRPRPAIAATGVVAALVNSVKQFTLPKGFAIQSKPGPGQQPQVFELRADTNVGPLDSVAAQPVLSDLPLSSDGFSVWLKGKVAGIKAGDKLLLLVTAAPAASQWLTVQSVAPQTDPSGQAVTQVTFSQSLGGGQAADFQLMKSGQSTVPWGYATSAAVIGASGIELASIARGIGVGDPVVLDVTGASDPAVSPSVVTIQAYSEAVWYANGDGPTAPSSSPPNVIPAVAVPHTHLDFDQTLQGNWNGNASHVTVRYGWISVGQLEPMLSPQANVLGATGALTPTAPAALPSDTPMAVLLQDVNGDGAGADATADSATPPVVSLSNLSSFPAQGLTAPIDILFNLLAVSRGKTVSNEVLGSGDATILGQDFTLKKSPVTYLQDPASLSGDNYSSTVQVWVNGIQWQEVRSFYGQPADAQVFLTREDEQGNTHVAFGGRLPTGVNNVVASYRYGARAEVPAAGTLTNVLQPWPGLKALRNPVPPGGGADADPPDKIRKLAPNSVMTFNRAVSLDDYEVIAGSAPGVTRVKGTFSFDALSQRPSITVWVGDDAGAVAAARAAIAASADPNRLVAVNPAIQLETALSLTYVRDPRYDDDAVRSALHAALIDPDQGLFGVNVVGIEQSFFDSQVYAACLAVPGVTAVHNLDLWRVAALQPRLAILRRAGVQLRERLIRGRNFVAVLPTASPPPIGLPPCRGHRYDPGAGSYFLIPDDADHFILASAVAS